MTIGATQEGAGEMKEDPEEDRAVTATDQSSQTPQKKEAPVLKEGAMNSKETEEDPKEDRAVTATDQRSQTQTEESSTRTEEGIDYKINLNNIY